MCVSCRYHRNRLKIAIRGILCNYKHQGMEQIDPISVPVSHAANTDWAMISLQSACDDFQRIERDAQYWHVYSDILDSVVRLGILMDMEFEL